MKGRITSLQRMSMHDGPGIRTVVFMKGCNMRCKWCHNPETWLAKSQMQYIEEKCIHCQTCLISCSKQAIEVVDGRISIDYSRCSACGTCAENCPTKALSMVGETISTNELLGRIEKDIPYFRTSEGGITLSGGEPLLQKEFVKEFMKLCREKEIHIAIETNLSASWETIEELLPLVNLWMCDLKLYDTDKHQHWTGIGNESILQNIRKMGERKIPMIVRTPVIPRVNDTEEEIEKICRFLAPFADSISYELLGFHTLGFQKYESLGMPNELKEEEGLSKERLNALKQILIKYHFIS